MSTYNIILLTDVILPATPRESVPIPAMGAYKLANSLRQSGYSCLVVNHISRFTIDEICSLLSSTIGPDTYLLGFSTTFFNLFQKIQSSNLTNLDLPLFPQGSEYDEKIFEHVKQLNDRVKVAVGGPMIRSNSKFKYADFLVLGYAEANIVNLVNHIRDGDELKNSYKNINNSKVIINNAMADGYEFSTDTMKWLPEDVVNHTKLPIEIGRGCVFSCAFCSYPMNGKQKLDFIKSAAILKEELLHNYYNYNITSYSIVDDTFNDSVEKLVQLREIIVTLPFQPKFWCYARLDLICAHPETLHLLYDIGIRSMYFGIETLDRKAGLAIGKGYDRQKQIAMISQIKEIYPDIHLHGNFIFGAPHETIESVEQTIKALLSHEIKLDFCNAYPMRIGRVENEYVFQSKITKDYAKFGYREMPGTNNATEVVWENDEMNVHIAEMLAKKLNDNYKPINGVYGGRQVLNYEALPARLFIPEYKRKLFELITNNK